MTSEVRLRILSVTFIYNEYSGQCGAAAGLNYNSEFDLQ